MVIGDESEFIAAILYDTPSRLPTQERMCRPMTTRARAEIDDEDDKHCRGIGLYFWAVKQSIDPDIDRTRHLVPQNVM